VRANMLEIVSTALVKGSAVPALTTYDFTTAQAVVAASESISRPVILLVAPKAAAGTTGQRFIRALRQLADDATTPVCVQLDHATDKDLIVSAIEAGADAVLVDGSSLPNDQNAQLVRDVRGMVGADIVLEAELGALPGDEDVALTSSASGMTSPQAVPSFLHASTADLLAVAVGNVHGYYTSEPKLRTGCLSSCMVLRESRRPI
jgi:tagatose 1,6-diphosphate aldolase GatY/KbaY